MQQCMSWPMLVKEIIPNWYDPSYLETDHSVFKICDWSEFYQDAKDAIVMNA